ncbi:MAG: tRNA-dihydrouridine synthase family protein [Alphaproteobacteria bacterium]|nr:tRNA-dihydrouridine synthase family protein [Alphaproteobacteria bacterium]
MHANTRLGPRHLPVSYTVRDVEVCPAVVLAPMEGVTDLAFRRLVRSIGGTGMTWTEFIPSAGLSRGEERWVQMAEFDDDEWPVAVQIYGNEPALLAEAARFVQDLGPTLVDINMGCPSKKVCKNSGGSALMKEPDLVRRIVAEVRAAVQLPLTVKMRSGFDAGQRNAPEIARICQEEGAEAITIHWRTREDRYSGERAVDKIAETVDRLSVPVIGNGDVVDVASAEAMLRETGCDGLMVGRGAMKDPWVFQKIGAWLRAEPPVVVTPADRRAALLGYLERCRRQFARDQGRRSNPEQAALGRFKQLSKHFLDDDDVRTAVLRSQTVDQAVAHVQRHFDALEERAA